MTRMAIVTGMESAWTAIAHFLRRTPDVARLVVTAAPWDDVPGNIQDAILSAADRDDVCAAIAFARGDRTDPPLAITWEPTLAFFAAVTPTVWEALPVEEKRTWLSHLDGENGHLAVRSLGLDPMFLACAALNDTLIATMRRRLHDDAAVQRMLLSIAVRESPLAAVPAVIAALPKPSDPVAFVQIAGGISWMPPALRDWIAAHPSPHALGAVTAVMRTAARFICDTLDARCAALAAAFAGWSSEDATALLAALPDDVRTTLHPGANALADALATPDRQDAFRKTLNALAALPPAAALPAFHALTVLVQTTNPLVQQEAGEGLAQALRDHGRIFAVIVGMLRDDVRAAIVPPPDAPSVESAINDLTIINPLVAHHLAYALRDADAAVALDALTASAPDTLTRIWGLLTEPLQQSVLGDREALLHDVAVPDGADMLAQALQNWVGEDNPLPWLALRMLLDADAERRTRGAALLAQRPDVAAALLPLLRNNVRAALESVPAIAFASADLPFAQTNAVVRVRRRRCSP